MAASREKQKAHRRKMLEQAKSSVTLHEPLAAEEAEALNGSKKIKLTVNSKHKSALIPGEGKSMGMDID
jgi:large subunit ribosomal protein L24e